MLYYFRFFLKTLLNVLVKMIKRYLFILFFLVVSPQVFANAVCDSLLNYYEAKLEKCIIDDYDSVQFYLNDLGIVIKKNRCPKMEFLYYEYNAVRYSYRYTSTYNSIDSVSKYYLKCIDLGKMNKIALSTVYYDLIYEHIVNCDNNKATKYLNQFKKYILSHNPEIINSKYSTVKATFFSYCLNKYDSAINYYKRSVDFYKEKNQPKELAIVLENIGLAYLELEDATKAKEYFNLALIIEKENRSKDGESFCKYQLARIIYKDEPELAQTYLAQSKKYFIQSNQLIRAAECSHLTASLYENAGDIKKAKESITESLEYLGVKNNSTLHLTVLQSYAEILYANKEYEKSIKVIEQALNLNQTFNILKHELELNEVLYKSFYQMGDKGKAYNTLLKYNNLKDSLNSIEQSLKVKEIEEKYELVKKEKALALANQQKQFFKKQRWFFAGVAALLGLFALLLIRQRNKKKVKELQAEMAEVQLASLKSQMNPHFMFNSINSIKGLIINEAAEAAADQLTRFSKLMRSTLVYSAEKEISLKEEIQFLELYSELERFKGRHPIEIQFDIEASIQVDQVKIIPFLIQPFVENAFKHAFHNMDDRLPILKISFTLDPQYLIVSIEDNGSGIKDENASAHNSRGTALVEKRLELHNGTLDNVTMDFRGHNLGTIVRFKIRNI